MVGSDHPKGAVVSHVECRCAVDQWWDLKHEIVGRAEASVCGSIDSMTNSVVESNTWEWMLTGEHGVLQKVKLRGSHPSDVHLVQCDQNATCDSKCSLIGKQLLDVCRWGQVDGTMCST